MINIGQLLVLGLCRPHFLPFKEKFDHLKRNCKVTLQIFVGSYISHSRMEHYFFSYLLIGEVYLIEVLEIMAQMLQYITFLSLKAIKVSSDFILNGPAKSLYQLYTVVYN